MNHLKSPTSPRLQCWAMFMSQFSYEIVYKKGRLHSNADGLSRMTYEPTEVPTSAVTDALMDDNGFNAMNIEMKESDFNSWLMQIADKEKESYKFGIELLYYTAAIRISDGERPPLDGKRPPLMWRDPTLIWVVPPLQICPNKRVLAVLFWRRSCTKGRQSCQRRQCLGKMQLATANSHLNIWHLLMPTLYQRQIRREQI